jgi:hypothetical protein
MLHCPCHSARLVNRVSGGSLTLSVARLAVCLCVRGPLFSVLSRGAYRLCPALSVACVFKVCAGRVPKVVIIIVIAKVPYATSVAACTRSKVRTSLSRVRSNLLFLFYIQFVLRNSRIMYYMKLSVLGVLK